MYGLWWNHPEMIDRYTTPPGVNPISTILCLRLSHYDHIMIQPHQCPIRTYNIQSFIYFPDTRYVIILAVWRTIIANPFTTASNTTVSFSNGFKPFDTAGMLCPGTVLRVSFSSHPIPHTHIIIFSYCIGV